MIHVGVSGKCGNGPQGSPVPARVPSIKHRHVPPMSCPTPRGPSEQRRWVPKTSLAHNQLTHGGQSPWRAPAIWSVPSHPATFLQLLPWPLFLGVFYTTSQELGTPMVDPRQAGAQEATGTGMQKAPETFLERTHRDWCPSTFILRDPPTLGDMLREPRGNKGSGSGPHTHIPHGQGLHLEYYHWPSPLHFSPLHPQNQDLAKNRALRRGSGVRGLFPGRREPAGPKTKSRKPESTAATQAHMPRDQVQRRTVSSLALGRGHILEAAGQTGTVRPPGRMAREFQRWAQTTGEPTTGHPAARQQQRQAREHVSSQLSPCGTPRYIPGRPLNHSCRLRSAKAPSTLHACQCQPKSLQPLPAHGGQGRDPQGESKATASLGQDQ